MKRLVVMLRVLLYLALGLALLYCPWLPVWTNNFFLTHHTWLSSAAHNDYVRGAISGVGVIDVWLAFEEVRRRRIPAKKAGASSSIS
ncbi:MAG: hypothetical protein ACRD3D_16260 [Terriglobia bacterium]